MMYHMGRAASTWAKSNALTYTRSGVSLNKPSFIRRKLLAELNLMRLGGPNIGTLFSPILVQA